jgi:hypothetical protein
MTDDERRSEAEAAVEREIRQARKFGAKDLMGRLAGPGSMKGASAVSPVQQAETEIGSWLGANLADTNGALKAVLHRRLKGSDLLLGNLDRPLVAVADYCRRLLAVDYRLKEIVGEADVEWGRAMDERPHFERDGVAPHPDDPYTVENVRQMVSDALKLLPDADG